MKHILYILLSLSSLTVTAQELPYKVIKKTSFHRDEPTPPTLTQLPVSSATTAGGVSGTDLGITPSSLDVSATGAAVYTIPIAVPAGINGVQPNLALTYNSQAGNDIAGYGWNITGISKISRVGSTPYHNGQLTGVNLTETDQFALDGQRLLLKEGTHGADGAVYETENFSNVKVIAKGTFGNGIFGPSYFEVLYPDGSKAYYGKGEKSSDPLQYNISSWENAIGISIIYKYVKVNNMSLPDVINYQGGSISFTYDPIPRKRPISFYVAGIYFENIRPLLSIDTYADKGHYRSYELQYDSNSLGYNRLINIQERVGGVLRNPIELRYTNIDNEGLSLIKSEGSLGLTGVSNLNSVVVSLDFNGDGYLDFIMYPTKGPDAYKKVYIFDGLRNKEAPFTIGVSMPEFKEIFPAQILSHLNYQMEGQAFIATRVKDNKLLFDIYSKYSITPFIYQYSKEFQIPTYTEERCYREDIDVPVKIKVLSGDFDGNGLTDILTIEEPLILSKDCEGEYGGHCSCKHYIEGGVKVNWLDLDRRKENNYTKHIGELEKQYENGDLLQAIDMNGDGKTDLVHISQGVIYVYELNEQYQLKKLIEEHNPLILYKKTLLFTHTIPPVIGDFNGDGKIDLMLPRTTSTKVYDILYGTGKGFTTKKEISLPFLYEVYPSPDGNGYIDTRLIAIDFNNDGKSDILEFRIGNRDKKEDFRGFKIYKNIGNTGDLFERIGSDRYIDFSTGSPGHLIFSNPDKKNVFMDISLLFDNCVETLYSQKNNKEEMLLRTINNKQAYSISYGKMESNEGKSRLDPETHYHGVLYEDAHFAHKFPYIGLGSVPSIYLVSKIERSGFNFPNTEQHFNYYGAYTHSDGLGFLGFKGICRSNWFEANKQNVQALYSYQERDILLRGAPANEYTLSYPSTYIPTLDFLSKTTYIYSHSEAPNKRFKLQLDKQVTEDKLKGITTTQSFAYDTDLNPTQITTETDGYRQVQELQYAPKESSPYRMGLLTHKRTASTLDGDTFTAEESYTYENGLISTAKTKGNGTGEHTEKFSYDPYGNITQKETIAEDGQKRSEQYTYDPTHRFIATHTDFEGLKTSFVYDERGNLSKETTPWGQSTSYQYDIWNRPIKVTDYLDKSLHTTYEANGSKYNIRSDSDDDSYTSETYNALGWLLESEASTALGATAVRYEYDALGRTIGKSEPFAAGGSPQGWTRTEYDRYGRPVQVTTAHGKTIRTSYDGLKTTVDDGSKQITTTQNAIGKTISQSDPGGTIKYTYFGNGTLKTANYEGVEQKITQDGWGRKTSLTDPAAGVYRYTYDSWGRLTEETTPKGKTTLTYEPNSDRIKSKHLVGDHTDMLIRYTYNAEKLLTQIDNENQDGNSDHYTYTYDHNRQLLTSSETNPWAKYTKAYTYDLFGRVQKEMTTAEAAGKRASAMVQYRYQNGELVEMKDDKGITLWKLTASNEYGQPLSLHKGKTKELLDYNTHFPKTQTIQREDTPLNVLQYDFNTQRGLLNHRTYSFYNQKEEFAYDTTDRLTRWGNATHQYDERGRITENSAIGTYEYTRNGYQQQKLTTNEAGETHLEKYPLPVIRYNAFKAPEQIYVKDKERISYEYNAFGERSHCYYGNAEVEKAKRPMLKHYSHDGSVEIVCNKTDNSTKFILYLGGDAYSAPAILISDGEASKLYYLHRDYLGSIVMLTDENGNIAERRHFDPWGQVVKVEDGSGKVLQGLTLLDRGFTGHEHLQTVGLINMNARLYDPVLHRFLQPDNYVQDPFNTQNFNRYGYCLNNPLLYTDQNGELFLLDDLIVGVAGFAFGYVYHGITTGDWGWNAVGAGGLGAGTALLSYYTMGGFSLAAGGSLSGGLSFAGNYMLSSTFNSFMPSFNIPISNNFSFSASLGLGFGSGTLGLGLNTSLNYTNGDFSASLGWGIGSGSTGDYSGWGASARYKGWGLGYTRTNYSSADNQVVGGISLYFRDVSFRLENDFFGDGHDRFRSNAFELTVGNFTLGSNLYNNDVGKNAEWVDGTMLNGKPNRPFKGQKMGAWKEGQTYSSPLWIGVKGTGSTIYRFGYSHPMVQDRTQNVTHKWVWFARTHFFNRYDEFKKGFYNYTGFNNPYSLW
ncbi:polymorphic toxin type 23 domain-containing protein [Capnocytophaga sputigena]|uniref:polymorphic toxin type 23 domain-containing protein n=1 Tax=Capnocytophaga sputigena TaxID=1019 RepID=UPI0028D8BEAB|nr:polymorphic toxin type 23 domain-containing protein [Capnocytophaga sputigena]